jgi:hypothetical protein
LSTRARRRPTSSALPVNCENIQECLLWQHVAWAREPSAVNGDPCRLPAKVQNSLPSGHGSVVQYSKSAFVAVVVPTGHCSATCPSRRPCRRWSAFPVFSWLERRCRGGGSHSVSRVDKVPLASPRHTPPHIVHVRHDEVVRRLDDQHVLGDQRYAGELLLVLVGHLLETSAPSHRRSRFTEALCTKRKIAFQANAAPNGQTNLPALQSSRSRRHPGGAVLDEIASLSTPGCRGALPSVTTLECAIVGVARTPVVSRLLLETPLRRCCWTRSRDPAVLHTSGCRDAVGRSPLQSVFLCFLLQYAYARACTRTLTVIGQRPRAHHSFSWTF